jgi:formylglycine-generating enzyme required for sulfatase activity
MVYVSWFGATSYCNWRSNEEGLTAVYSPGSQWSSDLNANGVRLPTETEWYKAACWNASAQVYRTYGTGSDSISTNDANFLNSGDTHEQDATRTAPVGSYGAASPYGLKDASGNAWEWCHNFYDASSTNPSVHRHALRGASWGNLKQQLVGTVRIDNPPDAVRNTVGFRVARSGF